MVGLANQSDLVGMHLIPDTPIVSGQKTITQNFKEPEGLFFRHVTGIWS